MKSICSVILISSLAFCVATPGLAAHAEASSTGCYDFNQIDPWSVSPTAAEQSTGGDNFDVGDVVVVTSVLDTATHAQVSLAMESGKEIAFHTVVGPSDAPGMLTYAITTAGPYAFNYDLAPGADGTVIAVIRCLPGIPQALTAANPLISGSRAEVGDATLKPIPLYSGPSTASAVLQQLPVGLSVVLTMEPIAIQNTLWYRVGTDFTAGWIKGQALSSSNGNNQTAPLTLYSDQTAALYITQLTAAINRKPTASFLFSRAIVYYGQGQYAKALTDLATIIKQGSMNVDVYLLQSTIEYDLNNYQAAIVSATAAIKLDAKNALLYLVRGKIYLSAQGYSPALQDFGTAIQLNPEFPSAYVNRAFIETYARNYAQSNADCAEALKIDPLTSSGYYVQALQFDAQGSLGQAIPMYLQAIHANLTYKEAYLALGRDYLLTMQNEKAITAIKFLLPLDPTNAFAYYDLGEANTALKQYPDAIQNYEKAVQYSGTANGCRACSYYGLGNVYFAQGDMDKAIDSYTHAIEVYPDYGDAYAKRALAYTAKGDAANAQADTEKAQLLIAAGHHDPYQ